MDEIEELDLFGGEETIQLSNSLVEKSLQKQFEENIERVLKAIEEGDQDEFLAVVERDERLLKYQDSYQYTLLHLACESKNPRREIVEYLCERIAINGTEVTGKMTPFFVAYGNEKINKEILRVMLEKGALTRTERNKGAPHYACENEAVSIEILEYLLSMKADPNCVTKRGKSPLFCLCTRNNVDFCKLKLVVRYGADVNLSDSRGCSLLHLLCKNSNFRLGTLQFLVEELKADLRRFDDEGNSIVSNNLEIKEYLKLSGLIQVEGGLLGSVRRGDLEQLRFILSQMRENNPFKQVALLEAFKPSEFNFEIVRELILSGTKPNFLSEFSLTPFQLLCSKPELTLEMLQFFVKSGADVNGGLSHRLTGK